MTRIAWSPQAIEDLVRLRSFLAAKNPRAATEAIVVIHKRVKELVLFPNSGRFARESGGSIREWLVPYSNSGYVILYEVADGEVTIARVRHMREAGYRSPEAEQP